MTEHEHKCSMCNAYEPCNSAMCNIGPLVHHDARGQTPIAEVQRPCSMCGTGIAEVDALPNPERGPLAYATVERVVARATRAALERASRDPESAPGIFAAHVDPLAPRDSTRQDPDTWARIGALLGSKAAWSGTNALAVPPDCPPGAPARCFIGAWGFAAAVVMQIRMEVGHGK